MTFKSPIRRGYRNIKRYRHIVSVLLKHGFHEFVYKSNLVQFAGFTKKFFPGKKLIPEEEKELTRWERIRLVLEELGPAFVKLGQFLSNRTDIIPKELCAELEKLLDKVAPFDSKMSRKTIEKELGAAISDIFSEFEDIPISSASISQVHRAVLKETGQETAVKVQRPDIAEIFDTDLEIMTHMAMLMEKFVEGVRELRPVEVIEDFRLEVANELNFSHEATNIEKFKQLFKDDSRVYFPKVHGKYTTTKVLSMEFIEGVKFSDIVTTPDKYSEYDLDEITGRLADIILKQVFVYGYFHADPHPGNLIIMRENRLCFIDLGLVGILLPAHREGLCEIITGIVKHDPSRITAAIINLAENSEINNRSRLEFRVFKLVEEYAYLPLKDVNIGFLLGEAIKIILDNRIKIPSDLFLLLKALIILEGAARKIRPEFNMISHIEPFVKKIIYQNTNPVFLLKEMYQSGIKYTKLIHDMPDTIREIIEQIKNKTAKVQFEHKGLEAMLHKHDQISNRIAYAIVTASMLICSALILHAGIPPKIHDISLIGIATFLFALVMSSLLLISILRHGKM